jgi:WD40 repeat protein
MGVVYKARQVQLNRLVALKMILSGGHAGDEERVRFLAEAEVIASIKHPGIVQIHDFGTHEGLPFFALELCEGGSLAGRLNGTPLPPRESAHLVEQLAQAMQAAHEQGIVHRDLKPANVLVSQAFHPDSSHPHPAVRRESLICKITDFGLARRVEGGSGLTQTGAIMGTPSYMSPEQAEGKKDIGPAADVYALGAILYECLTGRPPFRAATTFDTIMQVIGEESVPPSRLNPKVPRDLEIICLKCLRKEPGKRYSSAEALAEDLERWQRGEPVLARPLGLVERLVKWGRRRPAVAALLAGIVSLTAAALVVITALYHDAAWQAGEAAREARRAQQAEKQAEQDRDHAKEQEGAARRAEEEARKQERTAREQEGRTRQQKERAEEQLDRAERLLYASQIQAAQREWEAGNVALAWEQLGSCRWDYRDLEHRYLFTLFNHKQTTLKGHTSMVYSVAVSGDGKRIVSGSEDRTVKVWDAQTGKNLLTLTGHTMAVTSVALSSDGKRVVSGSRDRTLRVWDTQTGKDLLTLTGHTMAVTSVVLSSDGSRIVSGSEDRTLRVWDARTGKSLRTLLGHRSAAAGVALSGDGRRIVSGSADRTVKVWDAQSGKNLLSLTGHTGRVASVAFSPDGKRIVSASDDRTLKVWDAQSGKEVLSLEGHTSNVHSVAVSGDGARFVSGSHDGTVKVWDARVGKNLLTLKGHAHGIYSVAVSSDGGRIVSASYDSLVKVWDARTSDDLRFTGHMGAVESVAVSGDGKRIVSGSRDRTLRVWDTQTGKTLVTLTGHTMAITSVAVSGDGTRVVSGSHDRTVKVWDAQTGKNLLTLTGHTMAVTSVALSSDGSRIVSGSHDRKVKLWDAQTGKILRTLEGHSGGVNSVALSSDGSRIVSGSEDRTLRVWDARTGRSLLTLDHPVGVTRVAVSADCRRIVSGSHAGAVMVQDAASGKNLLTLKGHASDVLGIAVSGDGSRVVTAGWDRRVKVWDTHTGKDLLTLTGDTTEVRCVALSSGGHIITGAANQPTIKVWDAGLGEDRLTLKGSALPIRRAAFGRDGKQILGQDEKGKILAWDAVSGQMLPDPPMHMPAGGQQARTRDGKLSVHLENGAICVVRAGLKEKRLQRDRTFLERLARFDPDWQHQQLAASLAAEDDFALAFHLERLARSGPRDCFEHVLWANALGRLGRRNDAAKQVAQAVGRLSRETNPQTAGMLFVQLLGVPWDKPTAENLLAYARGNLARQRTAVWLHCCGAAQYRAGQYAEAEQTLAESVKVNGRGGYVDTWLFQAMTSRQRGRCEEALRLLQRVEEWHRKQTFPAGRQGVLWVVLLREARKLIHTPPPMPKAADD